ncbi:SDR family NAD(P)-dependent oxidoreductase [Ideonella sp. BN130291]|uniref:SDR family NAD(P)-dependent oxidoreductase n=1 Tax=Ideonella sp. BN130291 TaxID=3112940 RepID=UPI002E261EC8|nr:SDR family NAD(P)-dependent oxidoreductase [Ideonella sp. BN130291]
MTSEPLRGRHALVTGAGSGIGAAVALALAEAGAHVTLLGRREAALQATRERLPQPERHAVCVADVSDEAQVRQCVGQAQHTRGPVTLLVNNAGQARSQPFLKSDPAHWREMLDVNLMGTVHCSHAVLPGMLQAGGGRIVNVASTAGLTGYAYVSAYCAAKHAVVGFTRALALELARKGVTVNAVCPGYTDTPLLDDAVHNIVAKTGQGEVSARAALAQHNPQGRLVQPAEVAHSVLWLCLDESASITGQAIAVAGGEIM